MKDRERMSHTFSFSPWSSTFKASSAASGGHALVTMMIKDVYFSSGKEQNILLLPVLFTPSWFSMPAEANGDAAAVPGNFDCASLILWYLWYCLVVDFDFVLTSLLILFHFVSFCFILFPSFFALRPHLPGVQRELQEALRVQGGQQNGAGHADVERNAPEVSGRDCAEQRTEKAYLGYFGVLVEV